MDRKVVAGSLIALPFVIGTFRAAQLWADGEATGHAVFHLIVAAAGLVLLTLAGIFWRPVRGRDSGRSFTVIALAALAVAQVLEALGAIGYDAENAGVKHGWLVRLHNTATAGGGIAFVLVLVAVPVALTSIATRFRRRTGHRGVSS